MEEEIWKPVIGYEGLYEVSNYGNVRGLYRRRYKQLLSPAKNNKGYRYVCLSKDGMSKCVKVYRIVAMAFIPNPYNLPEIDHIDGSRDNDAVWNLRWCTHAENVNNPITRERHRNASLGAKNNFFGRKHTKDTKALISAKNRGRLSGAKNPMYGIHRYGTDSPLHYEVLQYSMSGEFIREWSCAAEAERFYGISTGKITSVCRHYKSRKSAAGYKWEYKDCDKQNSTIFDTE